MSSPATRTLPWWRVPVETPRVSRMGRVASRSPTSPTSTCPWQTSHAYERYSRALRPTNCGASKPFSAAALFLWHPLLSGAPLLSDAPSLSDALSLSGAPLAAPIPPRCPRLAPFLNSAPQQLGKRSGSLRKGAILCEESDAGAAKRPARSRRCPRTRLECPADGKSALVNATEQVGYKASDDQPRSAGE
jgi:hypothetical protein